MPAGFSSSYMAKIRRGVRRYQKERSKLIRSGITGGTVPERVTLKSLLSSNFGKREINRALKEMSLFTAAKARKTREIGGQTYSQYEIERFRLRLGRERKATARELATMTGFDAESPLAHNQYIKRLQARQKEIVKVWSKIIGTRAGAEVEAKAVKSENFYGNWINALFQDANKLGFPQYKIDEIVKKLNKLTPQQFERMYAEDPAIGYIFSYYNVEVRGTTRGRVAKNDALEAFEDLYSRIDRTIERYRNI